MKRVRIRIFLLFFVGAIFCNLEGVVIGAPMPPEIAVNDQTRQCAQVMRGDECMNCYLPEGWEVLGLYPDMPCPDGYKMIDLDLDCVTDYACREMTGQNAVSDGTPRLTLIAIIAGAACCGLTLIIVVVVLTVFLLNRRKKSPAIGKKTE